MQTSRYLLPCSSCGKNVTVETRQAGDVVDCRCGNRLEVPAFRQLVALEPGAEAPADKAALPQRWTARQGLLLLGSVILLVTFGSGFYVWATPPPSLTLNVEQIHALTPVQAWHLWKIEIVERGFTGPAPPLVAQYKELVELHQKRYLMIGFFAAIGALVLGTGFFWKASSPVLSRQPISSRPGGLG